MMLGAGGRPLAMKGGTKSETWKQLQRLELCFREILRLLALPKCYETYPILPP